jgi:hypothetical protein
MGFDPATKRVVVFGGETCPAPSVDEVVGCEYQQTSTVLADTWTWDGSAWSQLQTNHRPPVVYFRCCFGGAAADPSHGNLILVTTGALDSNVVAQTWVLRNGDWQRLHPKHSPPTLEFSNPAYDAISGHVIVQQSAGGHDMCGTNGCGNRPTLRYDTTWSWDGSDWSDLGTIAKTPHDYGQLLSVGQHGVLLVSGGVLLWNGSSWASSSQLQMPESVSPSMRGRYDWAAAYHEPTQRLVLVGGRAPGTNHLYGSTAGWDGSLWATLAPAPPSPSVPLRPCDPKKVGGGLGGQWDPSNPVANMMSLDFFEPPAGPCHLTIAVVMTLRGADGSTAAVAGNPSTQRIDVDLSWEAGGQRVIFTLTGMCAIDDAVTVEITAGDLDFTEPIGFFRFGPGAVRPCTSSTPPTPSISPSIRPTGLRP